MIKMIEIFCSVEGFRRGGKAHKQGKTVYPIDEFTDLQIRQLKAEPRLVVREFEKKEEKTPPKTGANKAPENKSSNEPPKNEDQKQNTEKDKK